MKKHFLIKTDYRSSTAKLALEILEGKSVPEFHKLGGQNGAIFSSDTLKKYIEKEEKHGIKILPSPDGQALISRSSGEQRKALLTHILKQLPDFLILVNPYDHLDTKTSVWIKNELVHLSKEISLVQFSNRLEDLLPISASYYVLKQDKLRAYPSLAQIKKIVKSNSTKALPQIPNPLKTIACSNSDLIRLEQVTVNFYGKYVLNNINWTIKNGEFWQLVGPNGSGKSTLISMITGDSHKGYGQNLFLFGKKKGSGESVWDIKKNIGYFSPAMISRFKGNHSLEHMLISGLHDSVGLYLKPSETEKQLAHAWLQILGLLEKKNILFHRISVGEQRLIMTARAMIKHPPLLILDEPTIGLDNRASSFLVQLVNHFAKGSNSALIFVSHREETNLEPSHVLQLIPTKEGSNGVIRAGSTKNWN